MRNRNMITYDDLEDIFYTIGLILLAPLLIVISPFYYSYELIKYLRMDEYEKRELKTKKDLEKIIEKIDEIEKKIIIDLYHRKIIGINRVDNYWVRQFDDYFSMIEYLNKTYFLSEMRDQKLKELGI